MKSQSIVDLLNESEHIYGILDLGDEIHSIWDLWRSGLQECKCNGFFGSQTGRAKVFGRVQKIPTSLRGVAPNILFLPRMAHRG